MIVSIDGIGTEYRFGLVSESAEELERKDESALEAYLQSVAVVQIMGPDAQNLYYGLSMEYFTVRESVNGAVVDRGLVRPIFALDFDVKAATGIPRKAKESLCFALSRHKADLQRVATLRQAEDGTALESRTDLEGTFEYRFDGVMCSQVRNIVFLAEVVPSQEGIHGWEVLHQVGVILKDKTVVVGSAQFSGTRDEVEFWFNGSDV